MDNYSKLLFFDFKYNLFLDLDYSKYTTRPINSLTNDFTPLPKFFLCSQPILVCLASKNKNYASL